MTFISPHGSPHRADICERRPSANDLHAATHEAPDFFFYIYLFIYASYAVTPDTEEV